MSYKTFEIVDGELIIKPAIYKGIASCKSNKLKSYDNMVENYLPWMLEKDETDNSSIDTLLDTKTLDEYDDMFSCDDELEYGSDLIDIGLDD